MSDEYSSPEAKRWFTWFDSVCDQAKASPVGKILTAHGFTIQHTGGGCLAWEKCTDTHYAWITGEDGASLEDDAADPATVTFLCGLYDEDGECDEEMQPTVVGAEAAADWCDRALTEIGANK
jgi:hypothetical protein